MMPAKNYQDKPNATCSCWHSSIPIVHIKVYSCASLQESIRQYSETPFQNTLHMHKQIVTILINLVVMPTTV